MTTPAQSSPLGPARVNPPLAQSLVFTDLEHTQYVLTNISYSQTYRRKPDRPHVRVIDIRSGGRSGAPFSI